MDYFVVVKSINEKNESSGLIPTVQSQSGHVFYKNRVEIFGDLNVVGRAKRLKRVRR